MRMKPILRVGVYNNFNHTPQEMHQLKRFEKDYNIFVNSNSFTEIKRGYPCIVTINPYLNSFVKPKGSIKSIAAVRIKLVQGANPKVQKAFDQSVEWAKKNNKTILITHMRFISWKDVNNYSNTPEAYEFKKGYLRLKKKGKKDPSMHYCDWKDKGCPECLNCTYLTYGTKDVEIHGINLSTSGICPYNCPSCYAKKLTKVWGITFDRITQNRKQTGKLHEKKKKT